MSLTKELLGRVDALSQELVKLTRDLIRVPSENPPGDERGVSQLVAEKLNSIGLDVVQIVLKLKRVNTLAALKRRGACRNLLFNDHNDTVPVVSRSSGRRVPLTVQLKARAFGPGDTYMSGGTAPTSG